jgi:hypothetical protein
MTLVPVSREMLAKIQPGGRVQYYTCPMAEHSDVHQDKPGKCPRCGMTLIPVMHETKRPTPPATEAQMAEHQKAAPTLYTCPMSQDSDVVSDVPGLCSKCGMKLVPTSSVDHGPRAEAKWHEQHAPGQAAMPPQMARPAE